MGGGYYNNSYYVIDYSAAGIRRKGGKGSYDIGLGVLKLHVTYRSIEQFLLDLRKGDEISESVVRYGIPFIGSEKFNRIIQRIEIPKRESLYRVEYSELELFSTVSYSVLGVRRLYMIPPSSEKIIGVVVELNGRIF